MKKIGKVLSRTMKGEFGKRKNPLPKNLSFLSSIPFYAVTECKPPDSEIIQIRVEILPSSLKKVAGPYIQYKKLDKERKKALSMLEEARKLFAEQQEYVEALEKANVQLMENLGEGPKTPRSEIKSYLQKAEEIGFISRGLPLSGGLPSLGKKR